MNRFFTRFACCLLACCLLAGCGKEAESSARPAVLPEYNPNPLTGLEKDAGYPYGQRPIAVMVNNISDSLPQSGIGGADLIYEIVTEGGITRFLAVYSDISKAGGYIGPVRSARDQHLQLVLPFSPLMVHIGSSNTARDLLETYHYSDKDLDGNPSTVRDAAFWLDEERHESRLIEHCWYTSPQLISAGIEKYKLSASCEEYDPIFHFRSYKEAPRSLAISGAENLHLQFSSTYYSDFSYDAVSGLYQKSQQGEPQIDALTGQQLSFTNLIVLFTEITTQPNGVLSEVDYRYGGVGYYFSNGSYEPIRWAKGSPEDPLKILTPGNEEKEVELNCGKSYIAVVGLDQFLNFTINGTNPLSGQPAEDLTPAEQELAESVSQSSAGSNTLSSKP